MFGQIEPETPRAVVCFGVFGCGTLAQSLILMRTETHKLPPQNLALTLCTIATDIIVYRTLILLPICTCVTIFGLSKAAPNIQDMDLFPKRHTVHLLSGLVIFHVLLSWYQSVLKVMSLMCSIKTLFRCVSVMSSQEVQPTRMN